MPLPGRVRNCKTCNFLSTLISWNILTNWNFSLKQYKLQSRESVQYRTHPRTLPATALKHRHNAQEFARIISPSISTFSGKWWGRRRHQRRIPRCINPTTTKNRLSWHSAVMINRASLSYETCNMSEWWEWAREEERKNDEDGNAFQETKFLSMKLKPRYEFLRNESNTA